MPLVLGEAAIAALLDDACTGLQVLWNLVIEDRTRRSIRLEDRNMVSTLQHTRST